MKTPNPQGQKACHTGRMLEKIVESMLDTAGFERMNNIEAKKQIEAGETNKKWYASQYKGLIGEYGVPVVVDFIVYSPIEFRTGLVIEVKYQKVGGSVDEKYPYVFLNFRKWFKEGINTALFMEGGGYRQCALDWCKNNSCPGIVVVEGTSDIMQWMLSRIK